MSVVEANVLKDLESMFGILDIGYLYILIVCLDGWINKLHAIPIIDTQLLN